MSNPEACDFCQPEKFSNRLIMLGEKVFSIVSDPSYRDNHCLVIPVQHVERISQLTESAMVAMLTEIGRLERSIASKHGSAVLQKYHPTGPNNGIRQTHLHVHVVPRLPEDDKTNPFGGPLSYKEFHALTDEQLAETLRSTKL